MKLEFLGVGEAFDPSLGATSCLLHSESKLLVDCGYATPEKVFSRFPEPDFLQAIYLTHLHSDHTFGLPAVLTRLHEDGRNSSLAIIGQPGLTHYVNQLLDLGYAGVREKYCYRLEFVETIKALEFRELRLSFAETAHSVRNFAVKIERNGLAVAISGDGALTPASRELFSDCEVLIHSAYRYDKAPPIHASAVDICNLACRIPKLRALGLVHLQRDERKNRLEDYIALGNRTSFDVVVPNPGDIWNL